MEDRRLVLREERPFDYKVVGGEKALIYHRNRLVFTAVGKDYRKLTTAIDGGDAYTLQLVMAKMTGHFKHETGA